MQNGGPAAGEDGGLYLAAVSPARQALRQAGHLLDLAEATGAALPLLSARLAPGMMNAGEQLRTTAGFALRATLPLTGQAAALPDCRLDPPGLRDLFAVAGTRIATLTPSDFSGAASRLITHRAGEAELVQDGATYLHQFAIPNLWFHLGMAYAILRAEGLRIGKADFDGLHQYSP
jgi:hypothetical protein